MLRSRQTALGLLAPIWLAGMPPGEPIALVEHQGTILLGTTRGLFREEAAGWGSVSSGGAVRDLAALAGSTLVAASGGLYEWTHGDPAPHAVPLAAGARVGSVAAGPGGAAWAATEVGLFVRPAGGSRFFRETKLPLGAVRAVRTAGSDVWAAARGTLWRKREGGEFEPVLRALDPGWWELCDSAESLRSTYLCVPRGVWRVAEDGSTAIDPAVGLLRGLVLAGDELWLAAERGLVRVPLEDFAAPGQDPPPARLANPVLDVESAAVDLTLTQRGLVAATYRGIAVLTAPGRGELSLRYASVRSGGAPALETLHRAVLAFQQLSPERLTRVERRARKLGLLPELRTSFSVQRSQGHERDEDQAWSSGSVRETLDFGAERERKFEFEVQLSWDFGQLARPDEALDASRERRALIELRDQVLDRVNRLYFERLRVLAQLARATAPTARAELGLRASELEGGLDAWSGGFFSRSVRRRHTDSPPPTGSDP